ncbi:hypothetical protein CJF32_00004781 [Rutstroemia sp. NJR-2017a WRK4]|nr:hypothetical protein CJF32_00004781 [Rutstroemia sp. NJR-2017a WRK4]
MTTHTTTTTSDLVTMQKTRIIKTYVSPNKSTKIILITTIITTQQLLFSTEQNRWVVRRTTEIKKMMVRKRLRSNRNARAGGVVKRGKGKGGKGRGKRFDSL